MHKRMAGSQVRCAVDEMAEIAYQDDKAMVKKNEPGRSRGVQR